MWSQTRAVSRRGVRPRGAPRPTARGRASPVAATVLVLAACAGPTTDLDARIDQMLEAGPGRDSSAYRPLGTTENDRLAAAVLAGLAGSDDPPLPDGTQVLQAVDGADRPVRIVAEDMDVGELQGLGLYAVREGAGVPPELVIEVPHPRADRLTEDLGPELFAALDAQALFVAGAHRTADDGAADVAHEADSTFSAVDRAVVGRGTVVLQVHGFDDSNHDGSDQVVLSSGERTPSPLVRDLDEALEDAGIDTCLYDGERCRELAGSTNVQGAHARAVGATFIHLELATDLREDGAGRKELVEILTEVLAR
jgi:hypothetical protein